jgi:hypothetical protein
MKRLFTARLVAVAILLQLLVWSLPISGVAAQSTSSSPVPFGQSATVRSLDMTVQFTVVEVVRHAEQQLLRASFTNSIYQSGPMEEQVLIKLRYTALDGPVDKQYIPSPFTEWAFRQANGRDGTYYRGTPPSPTWVDSASWVRRGETREIWIAAIVDRDVDFDLVYGKYIRPVTVFSLVPTDSGRNPSQSATAGQAPAAAPCTLSPGAVVSLAGTSHLWIVDQDAALHWAGDTRALNGRTINWAQQCTVDAAGLRRLPIGDPWLSAGLLKQGDDIYLVKWEQSEASPSLLHIQSITDVELFGINGNNYGRMVFDTPAWQTRYSMRADTLSRGELPPAIPRRPAPAVSAPAASSSGATIAYCNDGWERANTGNGTCSEHGGDYVPGRSQAATASSSYGSSSYGSAYSPSTSTGYSLPGNGYGQISTETGRVRDQYVSGYTRSDGTYVAPYYRSSPRR